MADIDIPFNYDPADNLETATSYTVPANKFAIISVTLNTDAYGVFFGDTDATGTDSMGSATSDSNSASIELRLKAGSVLTKTETNLNISVNNAINGSYLSTNGRSLAAVLVDGVEVSRVTSRASASMRVIGTAVSRTVLCSGTAEVRWSVAEYNSIT